MIYRGFRVMQQLIKQCSVGGLWTSVLPVTDRRRLSFVALGKIYDLIYDNNNRVIVVGV